MFFLDALDEAQIEQDVIINEISECIENAPSHVQFCISSRPSADFNFHLADSKAHIRLDDHLSEDIEHFVRKSFHEVGIRLKKDYRTLVDAVVLKAENVFLWVRLVVDDLIRAAKRRESIERLHERLSKMPVQLTAFYQRMLDEASEYDRAEVLRILGMVLCAFEPLALDELQDAIEHCPNHLSPDIDTGQSLTGMEPRSHREQDSVVELSERFELLCFGLIEVRTLQSGMNERKLVFFSHHTVNEFLRKFQIGAEAQTNVSLMAMGSLDMLKACVHCMTMIKAKGYFRVVDLEDQIRQLTLTDGNTSTQVISEWSKNADQSSWSEAELNIQAYLICPFFRYAAAHWGQHARKVELETTGSYRSILAPLAPFNFALWSLLVRHTNQAWGGVKGRQIITATTLLEVAITFCLTKYVQEELQSRQATSSVNTRQQDAISDFNSDFGCLLYAAASGGHVEVVEVLLVYGAKLDPNLSSVSSAIVRALYYGNIGVASALAQHGAGINDHESKTPGVYLKGYAVQSQYKTTDILAVRIGNQPLCLKSPPSAFLASDVTKDDLLFHGFWSKVKVSTPIENMNLMAGWGPEIAIDNYNVVLGDQVE